MSTDREISKKHRLTAILREEDPDGSPVVEPRQSSSSSSAVATPSIQGGQLLQTARESGEVVEDHSSKKRVRERQVQEYPSDEEGDDATRRDMEADEQRELLLEAKKDSLVAFFLFWPSLQHPTPLRFRT